MRGLRLIVAAAAFLPAACVTTPPADPNAAFRAFEDAFVGELMAFYPEFAVQNGNYRHAREVTIQDAAWQGRELEFLAKQSKALERFDPTRLAPLLRADYVQIDNFLKGSRCAHGNGTRRSRITTRPTCWT